MARYSNKYWNKKPIKRYADYLAEDVAKGNMTPDEMRDSLRAYHRAYPPPDIAVNKRNG